MDKLAQDEARTLISILNSLHFLPEESRLINPIIDKLQTMVTEPGLAPSIVVSPSNINIKINKK